MAKTRSFTSARERRRGEERVARGPGTLSARVRPSGLVGGVTGSVNEASRKGGRAATAAGTVGAAWVGVPLPPPMMATQMPMMTNGRAAR